MNFYKTSIKIHFMKYLFPLFIVSFLLAFSCNKSVKKEYLKSVNITPAEFEARKSTCRDQLNYIPDLQHLDQTPIKYIRVNFHVMCNDEGKGNFDPKMGRYFINMVLKAANGKMKGNKKMNLPPGNDTPVLPMRYQYVLTGHPSDAKDDGIYFHNDDELYGMIGSGKNRNIYNKDVYNKYGIQKDTVLNIFIMTHPIDSLKSKTYVKDSKGIGYPDFVKVTNWFYKLKNARWENGKLEGTLNKWNAVKLLNHEIGHSLGLRHSWRGNDGCDDTPTHSNCWNKTKGKAPCDVYWSNNFMDYNAHSSAWSPCQIGTIHRNMADKKKKIRKLLVKKWCTLDEQKTVTISRDTDWLGAKDLEGNLIIENGATLTVHCRLSIPGKGKIIIKPKGKLVLDGATLENDCGDNWKGIELWSKDENKGSIEIFNDSKILHVENEIEMKDRES